MRRRPWLPILAFSAMLLAWWVMYALVAWWTPIQGDDWGQLAWLEHHDPVAVADVLDALYTEPTTGDVGHLLGVALPAVHAVLAPTVIVLFIVGLFAVAFARRPDPRSWDDLWKLALVHTLVWLGAARVGVIFGHRPHVAHFIYGLCAAVWVVAAFRAAGPSPRAPVSGRRGGVMLAIGMGVLGLLGGASNHHLAAAAVAYIIVAIVRRRRRGEPVPAWMWSALATMTIGLLLLFTNPNPYFVALGPRGQPSTFEQIRSFLNEAGETVALASLVAFATLLKSRWRGTPMPVPTLGELSWMTVCFFGGFLIMALAFLGPRWGEPGVFAASVLFPAGAVVALARLGDDAWVKRAMIALTVVVHAIVVWKYVPAYHEAHRYGELRMKQLAAPPPGGIATITPYPQVGIEFWFLGEDLGSSAARELAAVEVFDLEDIVFDRETGVYEPSTGLEMHVEVDFAPQPSPEEVQRIIGRRVARNLLVARGQFRRVLVELRRRYELRGGALVVDNLDWPERRGRPVYAGRFVPGTGTVIPKAYWVRPDSMQRMRFRVNWRSLSTRDGTVREELYVIGMGDVFPTKRGKRWVYFVPRWAGIYVLVACGPDDCYVVESAWTRY